jgi:hypothetical protein
MGGAPSDTMGGSSDCGRCGGATRVSCQGRGFAGELDVGERGSWAPRTAFSTFSTLGSDAGFGAGAGGFGGSLLGTGGGKFGGGASGGS